MTLEELRKLRDSMQEAEQKLEGLPKGYSIDHDLFLSYRAACNVYEVAAVEYVDALIDAVPVEVKS